MGGLDRIDRTVGHSRRNACAPHGSKKSALETLDVGRIDANHINNAAGQDVTEKSEPSAKDEARFKLPCDSCSGLQDREGRRRKHVTETGLDGSVQGLIHSMGDGIERAPQTGNVLMWIQRIGIQCVSYAAAPSHLPVHPPSVLRIE